MGLLEKLKTDAKSSVFGSLSIGGSDRSRERFEDSLIFGKSKISHEKIGEVGGKDVSVDVVEPEAFDELADRLFGGD